MSNSKHENLIGLRHLLAERFPGVRMEAGPGPRTSTRWATGIPQLDYQLEGGLAKSAVTELVTPAVRSGGALLLAQVIRQAQQRSEWAALIDGGDSFDPSRLENQELSRLLWIRCSTAKEAVKAADLLIHDGSMPLIVLDLAWTPRLQLRRVPSSTWHRFARTVEHSGSALLILTPEPMVSVAQARFALQPRFSLDSIDAPWDVLLAQVAFEPVGDRVLTRRKSSQAAG